MADYNEEYKKIDILQDDTGGRIKLSTLQRHGESRKTKLKNNFTGMLEPADSGLLLQFCNILNAKLLQPTSNELVVGMYKSGIVMAGYLALARKTSFTWSTPDQLGDFAQAICYEEDHIKNKVHYLYGLRPGDKVILIEDEITSGKGMIGLTKTLTDRSIEVLAIASVLETVNFDGRANIKSSTGLDLISLVQIRLS
jgi:adenine/guanine phosphoribosyltransferase-like PRPP-binding protein